MTLCLQLPSKGNLEEATQEDDQAFTIDLSGNIQKGNLRDFLKRGYYMLLLEIDSKIVPVPETNVQLLRATLWINNPKPTVTDDLELDDPRDGEYKAFFIKGIDQKKLKQNTYEYFVLPHNPEILKAVRISISSQ